MDAWDCSVTFEVDMDVLKQEELKEMHEFWSGHEHKLREFKGDMLHAVLANAAYVVINTQFNYGYSLTGVIEEFDWKDGNGIEGYCAMDGSAGIKIIGISELDVGDFTAKELEV